ncbi:MAG: hypothetical protein ABA06_01475 [Parcubacteria bacterium C7867-001]|nr:MAG: hypothetical protein ABA06_01475 [Parcubacteria bacterium C7867-001]
MHLEDQRICSHASKSALGLIEIRYEAGLSKNRLPYHSRWHTESVIRRAAMIADAICVDDRSKMLAHVAAAFHDVVHERGAPQGENEWQSVVDFQFWVPSLALIEAKLSDAEQALVKEAILATSVSWSAEHQTIIQPNLMPDSDPVVRAVAMADIGSPGMEPDDFEKGSDLLFAERETDIMLALELSDGQDWVPKPLQNEYIARYVKWKETQLLFAKSRKALFETELGNLADGRNRMRALFSHFDESIDIADNHVLRARTIRFDELAALLMPNKFSAEA